MSSFYIPITIQELGFNCVNFLLNFSFALRAVSMNTATHLKEIISKISLSNSQLLNRKGYKREIRAIVARQGAPTETVLNAVAEEVRADTCIGCLQR